LSRRPTRLHHCSTTYFRHPTIYFRHRHPCRGSIHIELGFVLFFNFCPCYSESVSEVSVPSQEEEEEEKKNRKKSSKKNSEKSQIRIQVGSTRFLLVQSEISLNWTVSLVLIVLDNKLRLTITFAYELRRCTPFRTLRIPKRV
jgi:hypothetical protein